MSAPLRRALESLAASLQLDRNANGEIPRTAGNDSHHAKSASPPVEALVARIERVTGDRHSRANWLALTRTLTATPEGTDALLAEVCALEDATTRRDAAAHPIRRPGALLNARLREACARLPAV